MANTTDKLLEWACTQMDKGVESIMREIQRVSGTSHMAAASGEAAAPAANGWGPAQSHGQDIAGPSFSESDHEVLLASALLLRQLQGLSAMCKLTVEIRSDRAAHI